MEALGGLQDDLKLLVGKGLVNFKKSPKDRITQFYIETRLGTLEEQWKSFVDNHRTIITDVETTEYHSSSYYIDEVYEAVQEIYWDYKTQLLETLSNINKTSLSVCKDLLNNEPPASSMMPQVKLPEISIPMFSGKYTEWTTFKDLFESLVHRNTALENVHKLHYLKAHLTGEAEQLLRHIPVTDANYAEAWVLLNKRFSNKKYLSNCLMKRLLGQNTVTVESSQALKELLDTTCDCLNGLKNLGLPTHAWDVLVIFIISSKLDQESRKLWEAEISSTDDHPNINQFKSFLENRFRALEFLISTKPTKASQLQNTVCVHHVATAIPCPFCAEEHKLFNCKGFANEDTETRRNFVQTHGLCYNCMCPGHSVFTCRQTSRCRICRRKHHTLLHHSVPKPIENQTVDSSSSTSTDQNVVVATTTSLTKGNGNDSVIENLPYKQVLLATALVKVEAQTGKQLTFRSLIDQGSQASFITESAAQLLGIPRTPSKVIVSGIGNSTVSKCTVNIELSSVSDPTFRIQVKAHVLKKLPISIPARKITAQSCDHIIQIQLADPNYHKPDKVDLLLGAEVFGQIVEEGLLKGLPGSPIAQKTKLGWILSGQIHSHHEGEHQTQQNNGIISLHTCVSEDTLLKKFWELESEPSTSFRNNSKYYTQEEQDCEKLYEATTTRDDEGRYIVKLPFRSSDPQCQYGSSLDIAKKRFTYLEGKLNKNLKLKEQYSQVMAEYLSLGHMEMVPEEQTKNFKAVYLPHHAVVKEDRTTSKVRVVFDASTQGTNGVSLNQDLMIGPTLQLDLRHIIMRWRRHPIALIADIVKMYRQIKVATEDTDYQRVLWVNEIGIQHYRMLRVTFGTASAPYLAVKTLYQLAKDEGQAFPLVVSRIENDFYMDDLMTGCQSVKEGLEVYKEMNGIMRRGCFELQKWSSNHREIRNVIDKEREGVRETVEIGKEKVGMKIKKVLGLNWNESTDEFEYVVELPPLSVPVTKRKVLSDISRLFDPLGWIAPSIIQGKVFMQKLWMAGLDWDHELTPHLLKEWISYREQLTKLTKFTIPRWMQTSGDDVKVELHGFCDASKEAYAAVVYLRVTDSKKHVQVNLVTAKTKVSPVKAVSIPRLELCGAVLLTKLLCEVAEVLEISKANVHAWTDSQVVLAWLSSHPSKWKTFIANRVSDILVSLDRNQWSHVRSEENPADCASRALPPGNIEQLQLWKYGPSWLIQEHIEYSPLSNQETNLELNTAGNVVCTAVNIKENGLCARFSSFRRLVRVISYCKRFILAAKANANQARLEFPKWLTSKEIQQTSTILIRQMQSEFFIDELQALQRNVPISKKSSIQNLNTYLDSDGILRVGGRLQRAELSLSMKHPIVVPYRSHLTTLLIADAHERTLHGGPQLMLNYLRSKYWIVNARRAVKAYIHRCVPCVRHSSRVTNQLMGQLPSSRVNPSKPFQQSGVDYAGPISIRMSKGRGHRSTKGYICLFVCMATRAIHLEAVTDLTSEGFIAAFKRFIARRGQCTDLWSDNGTNFVGASKELFALMAKERASVNKDIADWLGTNGTNWHFIPPRAPNFGGIWEAGVRSTKHHLRRVIGTSTLTFEEISTVLAQIEACLNSRPLSLVSDDPGDPYPLTPGHFLVGGPLVLPPDSNYESANVSSLKRWHYTQKVLQDFWRRWSQEYLTQFCQRHKWSSHIPEPNIGDVVLVKEDDLPPARWLYGIITDKHPGLDGITRVVSLKCRGSTIKRPVSRLCILPVAN